MPRAYPGALVRCDGCDGCGQVTDGVIRLPWKWLVRESKAGDVRTNLYGSAPVDCAKCKGTGKCEYSKLGHHRNKGKRF